MGNSMGKKNTPQMRKAEAGTKRENTALSVLVRLGHKQGGCWLCSSHPRASVSPVSTSVRCFVCCGFWTETRDWCVLSKPYAIGPHLPDLMGSF